MTDWHLPSSVATRLPWTRRGDHCPFLPAVKCFMPMRAILNFVRLDIRGMETCCFIFTFTVSAWALPSRRLACKFQRRNCMLKWRPECPLRRSPFRKRLRPQRSKRPLQPRIPQMPSRQRSVRIRPDTVILKEAKRKKALSMFSAKSLCRHSFRLYKLQYLQLGYLNSSAPADQLGLSRWLTEVGCW